MNTLDTVFIALGLGDRAKGARVAGVAVLMALPGARDRARHRSGQMNGALSDVATIERIACIERELKELRADAYRRAGIPMPTDIGRMEKLTQLASSIFGISEGAIFGESRVRRIARARFAIIWVAHNAHGLSSTSIGRALGHRDHSTVLNGLNRAEEERENDAEFREITDELLALVTPKKASSEEAENARSSH